MKTIMKLLVLILISMLNACGGSGGGSSKEQDKLPPESLSPVETFIEGTAVKGTLANATVSVYKYIDNAPVALTSDELASSNLITDINGNYTITLFDYNGPLKIELSTNESTTMVCDAPAGCGETNYGEAIALQTVDPTFKLSAISIIDDSSNGTLTVNVSALTHIAAALIEDDTTGVNKASVQEKSSIIANTFNIIGDITTLEPTKVDNAEEVAGEDDPNELHYGLINAGVMSAIFNGENKATNILSSKLTDIIADVIENKGALLVKHSNTGGGHFKLAISDVLEGASNSAKKVSESIQADDILKSNTVIVADLKQRETNLENLKNAKESLAGQDGRNKPVITLPTDGDGIAKAKGMIEDVRLFTHLLDVKSASHQGGKTEGEAYLTLINDTGVMIEAEADSFILLSEVAEAIANLSIAHKNGTLTGTQFNIADYLSAPDANGIITFDETNYVFSINATGGDEVIALNVTLTLAADNLSATLAFNGSIDTDSAQLLLADSSLITVEFNQAVTLNDIAHDTINSEIIGGELALTLEVNQKASTEITNPISFKGTLSSSLAMVKVLSLENNIRREEYYEEFNFYEPPTQKEKLFPEVLSLSGQFNSLTGNVAKASLTINVENLESHEGNLQYLGQKVPEAFTYTFSDDLNTLIIEPSQDAIGHYVETINFIPEGSANNWTVNKTINYTNELFSSSQGNYTYTEISRTFPTGLDVDGIVFSRTKVNKDDNDFYAYSYHVVPEDTDGDNIADRFNAYSKIYNDYTYSVNLDINNLMNTNGDLLNGDGTIITLDENDYINDYYSLERAINSLSYIDPTKINNAATYISNVPSSGTYITDSGTVERFYDIKYKNVVSGISSKIDGYYTSKKLPQTIDNVLVTVNEDATQAVITSSKADILITHTFSGTAGDFIATKTLDPNDENSIYTYTSVSEDIGLDKAKLHLTLTGRESYENETVVNLPSSITPVDENSDNLTDYYQLEYVDYEGDIKTTKPKSIDKDDIGVLYKRTGFGFNPYTANNVLDIIKPYYSNYSSQWASYFVPEIISNASFSVWGIEKNIGLYIFSPQAYEVESLTAGSTDMFSLLVYDMHPDIAESFEGTVDSPSSFLDVNAALSLQLTLENYEVNLMLSGDRTSYEDGTFNLALSYKLPNDNVQRSFTAKVDSASSINRLTILNNEEVNLVMSKEENSNQIGSIKVAAVEVGKVVDRDGLILVVYNNGDVESL